MIVWTHNTLAVKLWQFMDRGKGTLTALSWWWNSCHRWGTLLAEFDGFKSPRTREVVATRMGMLWRNTLGTCHIYIYFPMFLFVGFFGIFPLGMLHPRHENAQNVSWLSWIRHLAGVRVAPWHGLVINCMILQGDPWDVSDCQSVTASNIPTSIFWHFFDIGIVTRVVATTSVKHAEKPLEQHISMSGTIWNILNIGFQRWNHIKLMFHRRKMSIFAKSWRCMTFSVAGSGGISDVGGRSYSECASCSFSYVAVILYLHCIYYYITWNYNCETIYIYTYNDLVDFLQMPIETPKTCI